MAPYSSYKPEKVRLHIVAAKALGLGAVSALCMATLVLSATWNSFSTRVALYTLSQCIFHTLEFFITAIYNTEEVDDDSFILGDQHLHYAFFASVAECAIESRLLKFHSFYLFLGLLVVGASQICRSLAMYTAGVSFNHHIQQEHASKHTLVTKGVYKYSRHPSYFAYFWWFIGTQLLLQNWVVAVFGIIRLHSFFRIRTEYEEAYLVSFFGDQYKAYRARTAVGIPFIK